MSVQTVMNRGHFIVSFLKNWLIVLLLALGMASSANAQETFTRSNTTGTSNIVDDGCFANFATKTINVTDVGTLVDLDVGIVANHDYRGALQVQLISPAGTNRTIVNGVGAGATDLNVRLSDGETTIAGNAHPDVATYANTANLRGPSNPLSAFTGESITGTWTLRICDSDAFNDTGALREFYLHMTLPSGSDLSLAVNPTAATRSPGQQTSFTLVVSNAGQFRGQSQLARLKLLLLLQVQVPLVMESLSPRFLVQVRLTKIQRPIMRPPNRMKMTRPRQVSRLWLPKRLLLRRWRVPSPVI